MSRTRKPATMAPPPASAELFGGTFTAWARGFLPNTALALCFHGPLLLLSPYVLDRVPMRPETHETWTEVRSGLELFVAILATAAISLHALHRLRGTPIGVAACLRRTGVRLGSILLASLILVGMLLLVLVPMFVVGAIVLSTTGRPSEHDAVGLGFGIVALFGAAFVFLAARYFVWPLGVVAAEAGAAQSLRDAARLSAGSRWRFLLMLIALGILTTAVDAGVRAVIAAPGDQALAATAATAMLHTPITACAVAVAYHRLRLHKDGIDVTRAADVFD